MPTFRQLKALGLIAQTGSFTKAAERMHITQSAVSVLMRELEEEVGQPLIERGRVIRLTDVGEHLHRAGNLAAQEVDRALQEIRDVRRWSRTVLRVAAGPLSAATIVPMALARLAHSPERPRVVLIDQPVRMLGDLLLAGEADLAVGSVDLPLRRSSSELKSTLLLADHLAIVCARCNALAQRALDAGGLTWADLAQAPLVLVGRNGGQWDSLLREQLAQHEGLTVGYEVQLLSTALELVRQDLGVAVLPRMATRMLDPAAFYAGPLRDASARWNTYCVTRGGRDVRQSASAAFLEALRQSIDESELTPR